MTFVLTHTMKIAENISFLHLRGRSDQVKQLDRYNFANYQRYMHQMTKPEFIYYVWRSLGRWRFWQLILEINNETKNIFLIFHLVRIIFYRRYNLLCSLDDQR